jgi:hypothetical protein
VSQLHFWTRVAACFSIGTLILTADPINTPQTRVLMQSLAVNYDSYDSGYVASNTNHSVVASGCIEGYGCSAANATANATVGSLGAAANTSGSVYAAATAQAYFTDYVTFGGGSYGTTVDVLVHQSLVGDLRGGGDNYYGYAESSFLDSVSSRCAGSPGNDVSDCNYDHSANMQFSVGPTYTFSGALTAAGSSTNDSFTNVPFAGTAHYYIDILTPGITLSSASGYSYQLSSSTAPETSSIALTGIGLIAIAGVARRRRRATI